MLDFLFFDPEIAQTFVHRVTGLNAPCSQKNTPEGGIEIGVQEEGLDDNQRQTLEDWYDELFFGEEADKVQQKEAGSEACGVQIQLADGEFTTVLLEPRIMGKLLSVLEAEEIQSLFSKIADAVENPQSMSVCHAMQCAMVDLTAQPIIANG